MYVAIIQCQLHMGLTFKTYKVRNITDLVHFKLILQTYINIVKYVVV